MTDYKTLNATNGYINDIVNSDLDKKDQDTVGMLQIRRAPILFASFTSY
jgi:hypothetical protein